VADLPQGAAVSRSPNPQQRAAIDARGSVFVAAGAGTGKTSVLVERFARSVVDDGLDVDSLLVITYTDRAAGELRGRIRERLLELGRPQLARELDGAWISTIHGFCRRLLSAYPLAAGIDPRFRVLDEPQSRVLQGEAFTAALSAFCAADEPDRWQLLATYRTHGLRSMLVSVYDTLRSAGRELVLEPGKREGLPDLIAQLEEAARCLVADDNATVAQRTAARGALDLLATTSLPERLLELEEHGARGVRAATYNDARKALRAAALEELAARDRELLQELLGGFAGAYAAAKDRESALDFEDLQLRARDR
jgi:ATP-dependent exoDNAse (exonuclease V) beta subunit